MTRPASVQNDWKQAKHEMQELHLCIAAANEKAAHREKALTSALSQLRSARASDPNCGTPTATADSSSASINRKSRKKGGKGKRKQQGHGISNATTSCAEAAKAADAAGREHSRLETMVEEQSRTIVEMQGKVDEALALHVRAAGV